MAGIQPYRNHESAQSANPMQGLSYSAAATSNMAAGVKPGAPSNVANPVQLYSTVKMDYYYPQFQIGVVEPVVVTQVLDPHHLFCQLRSLSHEVLRLLEGMNCYYEARGGCGDQEPAIVLGQPCASRGADGRWYRSLLQELFLEKELAMVIHVDWGRREIVSLSALQNLAAEFFRMPVVTFPCTLYGVSSGGLPWNPVLINELRTSLLGRHVTARIECYNSYEHLYGVTLFAEDGVSFNSLLAMRPQNPKVGQNNMAGTTELPLVPEGNLKTVCPTQIPYMSRYPPMELKVGKFEDAVVEFVIDPSNFWVRLGKFAENYKKMVDGMTALYFKAPRLEGVLTNLKPGQLCCASYEDMYYRVEVVAIENKRLVEVFFLDIGMSMAVDWSNIRELPAEYTKLPALANKCCLADTYPVENLWSEEAILAFKVAVTDKKLIIHVIAKDADEYIIEVMDQSRVEEKNVGKILAKTGLARFEELCSVNGHSGGDKIAHVESAKNALRVDASDYAPKVKETTDSCFREEHTEPLDYSPFQEQFYDPGATIEIVVSHVNNPGMFWCQNARSKTDLSTLMEAIQSHCKSTNCPYSSSTHACLAKSPRDGIWYRAFITKFPVTISKVSTVEVFYVDYGNHETVPLADLRAINGEFFQLKAQAFKCSLYNIITPTGDNPFLWDGEVTAVFREFVQKASNWTEFHCIFYATAFLDKKPFYIVDLYTPFAGLCDTLVKRGYAKHLHHKALAPCVRLHSYYYSTHDIKIGKEVAIHISHVESSSLFYAQLARNTALDMISSTILRVIEKTQKSKLPSISGALCLAKYSDQQWYRGHIQSENGTKKVFFVDFGNTEKVSEEDLLPIMSSEHDLLLIPMQAIKFSLSDIPSNVPGEIVTWFANAVLEKTLKAEIVSKDVDGKLSVQLYDGNQQINATIKGKLGLRVPKSNLAADKPKTFKQDDSRKLPDNTSDAERKTFFAVGKKGSRESNTCNRSDVGQEPEPRYRTNLAFHHKAENADYNSHSQELGGQRKMETGQRKTETGQRFSSSGSYQGSLGGRDARHDVNKPLPSRRSSISSAERQSSAKLPVVTFCDIPKRKIFPGMKESVYISHVNSVFDFYMQLAEDSRLDEMLEILNAKTSSFEDLGDEDVNVENVICAYFPDDGLYYRGVVRGKTKQGLCVEYIDYGNTSVLLDCKNYRLPQKCCSIPAMGIHCSLSKPKNASAAPNLQELSAMFSNRIRDIQLDCEFLKHDGHKWDVILKDELGSINDLLADSEPVLEENLKEVCEAFTKISIMKEEKTSVSGFTWNLPQPAATIKVYVSAVDGPDCFWCQLTTADIDSLASQVQQAGEQSVKNDGFLGALKVGSPCCVLFSEDNNWYRAMVTKMEADLVTVKFIDYGNEDSVGLDQIRKLPEPLGEIPPRAFSCCLVGFDMKAGTWTSEGIDYFYEKTTEDMVELTVCEIQESVSYPIPVALVTLVYDGLNINEEMRKFWQALPSTDLALPDESDDSSPVNVIEADRSGSYKDSSTTDSRSSHLGESAPEGQLEEYKSLGGEDCPRQMEVIGDIGEKPESATDAAGDAADLPHEARVDAVEDSDPSVLSNCDRQDMEDFDSYEENDGVTDVPTSTPMLFPRPQGVIVESGHPEIAAGRRFPDLKSSRQQDLLSRDTSESLESLILQFSEKLVLLNEEAISDGAAKEAEGAAQSDIKEDRTIAAEAETTEEFDDCTKGGTTQDNEGTDGPSEDYVQSEDLLTTNDDVESEETLQTNTGMEEAAFSEVAVTSEELKEYRNDPLELGSSASHEFLGKAGEVTQSITTQDSETTVEATEMADGLVPSLIKDYVHKVENIATNEDVEESDSVEPIEVNEESKEAITSKDVTEVIVDDKVSAEHLEIQPEDDILVLDEPIKEYMESSCEPLIYEDEMALANCDVDILEPEHPLDGIAVTKGEEGPASQDGIGIEAIHAENVFNGNKETLFSEAAEHLVAMPSKEIVQYEEDLTSCQIECGSVTTTDVEIIQEGKDLASPEGAIELASMSFEELKATVGVDPLIDLYQDFVASSGEGPVAVEHREFKDRMNKEAAVTGKELQAGEDKDPKDDINCEEVVADEDKELQAGEDKDPKDILNCEEVVADEDKELQGGEDKDPKDIINCEEVVVTDKDKELQAGEDKDPKDIINSEDVVTDEDKELQAGEDKDPKDIINCEEVVTDEDKELQAGEDKDPKDIINCEEVVTDEDKELQAGEDKDPKDIINCEDVVTDEDKKLQAGEDKDPKDIINCEEVVVTDEDKELQAGEDKDPKDIINCEEVVTDEDKELQAGEDKDPKDIINCEEVVTDEDKELQAGEDKDPKDIINCEEVVTDKDKELQAGEDKDPKDIINCEEVVVTDEDKELQAGEDKDPKDIINCEEVVTDKDKELQAGEETDPKDIINCEEVVTDKDKELQAGEDKDPKDIINCEEVVTDKDKELQAGEDKDPKDIINCEEVVTDKDKELQAGEDKDPKDIINCEEVVTDKDKELQAGEDKDPKDIINCEEVVTDKDKELQAGEDKDPKDILNCEDVVTDEDKELQAGEDKDLKDIINCEEVVTDKDKKLAYGIRHEVVAGENMKFKVLMDCEELVDSEDMELKESMNHAEIAAGEDLKFTVSLNHEEVAAKEDQELKDSIDPEDVVREDKELKYTMMHEEAAADRDQEHKESMNQEESVDFKDMGLKSRINHAGAVTNEDNKPKDPIIHTEVVTSEDMEPIGSMKYEESVTDKELKDSIKHKEAVAGENIEVKDSMNHEDPVDCKDKELKDSMNLEEPVDCEDKELKDSMSHEEPVDCEDMKLKDRMNHEEPVDCEDMKLKDSMNHEELVDCEDMKLKDRMNHEEPVDCEDMKLKDSMNHEEPVDCEDMKLKDRMNHEDVMAKEEREIEDSMNGKEVVVEDKELVEVMNCKAPVGCEDMAFKDCLNCKEALTDEEKEPKDGIKHEEAVTCEDVETEDAAAFEGKVFCESSSTDVDYKEPEIIQELVETLKSESVVEHLRTMTSKDVQTEEDLLSCSIIECGGMATADSDEESVTPVGSSEEASRSFEKLESTIVEGQLTDVSQGFVASASDGSVASEDMKLKDSESPEEAVAEGDVTLKHWMNYEEVEDIETEAGSFREHFCESLSTDDIIDHEELEVLQGEVETCEHDVDYESDVCDHNEDLSPTGHQPESFTVYRECPTIMTSTDSVYDGELNDLLEVTDSDYEGLEPSI